MQRPRQRGDNPIVFFDVSIGEKTVGRLLIETMSTTEENAVLKRLVYDLEFKKTLCCCDDYPGVSEKVLNEYLAEHGPLTNPVFGKMRVFWIDEGYFVPGQDVVPAAVSWHP
ncbi:hypothetical protein PR003_g21827 [Phytophthora rubi]|uniref:Uncharacterized protein n=1 Tax=Phytophthora rubi TaxID=129364 RepID=A0A6A4DJ70_9STRA|nr:hypothetical protein PR003_g21827 [Phytophthora rubi]